MINKMMKVIKEREQIYQMLVDREASVGDKVNEQNNLIRLYTIKALLIELEDELDWQVV